LIKVIVRNVLLAAVLAGAAIIMLIASRTPNDPCAADTRLARAAVALTGGRAMLVARNYAGANESFDTAIGALGSSYYSRDWIDDTDQHLAGAQFEARKDNLQRAATEKEGVLESRIVMYRSTHRCPDRDR
jgi:hypothetical protein